MARFEDYENPQINNEHDLEIDIPSMFHFLISKIWIIIFVTALGGVLGFGISKVFITPLYSATSKIYIVNTSDESKVNLNDLQVGSNLVNDYLSLLKNRMLIDSVITNLDLSYDYDTLSNMINVTNPSNTREINLTVTSPDPEEAQLVSNELARQAIEYLPSITGAKAPYLVENAVFPNEPSLPNSKKNALIGSLISFIAVTGFYIIKFILNDSYRTPDDIQKSYGVMPLASIPEDTTISNSKKKRKR